MAEQTAPTKGTEETTNGQGDSFEPITSQDEFDKRIQARIARERKRFDDYDELKSRAAKLTEIEESQKSETQKLQERISGLEAELAASQTAATRSQIQARYGISEEDAALFLTATDSDGLEAQAKALAERINKQMKNGPVVLADRGKPSEGGSDAMRELAQRVFKN